MAAIEVFEHQRDPFVVAPRPQLGLGAGIPDGTSIWMVISCRCMVGGARIDLGPDMSTYVLMSRDSHRTDGTAHQSVAHAIVSTRMPPIDQDTAGGMRLFMVLLGATVPGRHTEQHDVYFGVATNLQALIPRVAAFWPDAEVHIDAWMCVEHIDGFVVQVMPRSAPAQPSAHELFFVNLGGYKPGHFEEYHEKFLVVADSLTNAVARCKESEFYRTGKTYKLAGGSHTDDKARVSDLIWREDDVLAVGAMIDDGWVLRLTPDSRPDSPQAIGYLTLAKLTTTAV